MNNTLHQTKDLELTASKIGNETRYFIDGKDGQSYENYVSLDATITRMHELQDEIDGIKTEELQDLTDDDIDWLYDFVGQLGS